MTEAEINALAEAVAAVVRPCMAEVQEKLALALKERDRERAANDAINNAHVDLNLQIEALKKELGETRGGPERCSQTEG